MINENSPLPINARTTHSEPYCGRTTARQDSKIFGNLRSIGDKWQVYINELGQLSNKFVRNIWTIVCKTHNHCFWHYDNDSGFSSSSSYWFWYRYSLNDIWSSIQLRDFCSNANRKFKLASNIYNIAKPQITSISYSYISLFRVVRQASIVSPLGSELYTAWGLE